MIYLGVIDTQIFKKQKNYALKSNLSALPPVGFQKRQKQNSWVATALLRLQLSWKLPTYLVFTVQQCRLSCRILSIKVRIIKKWACKVKRTFNDKFNNSVLLIKMSEDHGSEQYSTWVWTKFVILYTLTLSLKFTGGEISLFFNTLDDTFYV